MSFQNLDRYCRFFSRVVFSPKQGRMPMRVASGRAPALFALCTVASLSLVGIAQAARFEKGATRIDLPEGICDGNYDVVPYQHLRNGILYKGTFKARNLIQCTPEGGGVEGVFDERGYDTESNTWYACQGSVQLDISEEGMDATWTVWGRSNQGSCNSVGRTYVTNDILANSGARGSFVSLANHSGEALRSQKVFTILRPMACFQNAHNNSKVMAELPAGFTFDAAQGSGVTLIHLDSNQSPFLELTANGERCFVRAGIKYVGLGAM